MNAYNKAIFLKSAAKLSDLVPDEGTEVAFVGRSNAGKSSLLNALTGRRDLARVSNTPGRTQLINLFSLDDHRRLVDLPGFGYAKVSRSIRENWQEELTRYLEERHCLKLLIMVMDIRHPFQPIEQELLGWAKGARIDVHIVLNKSDKLSRSAAGIVLSTAKKTLSLNNSHASVQLFSALKKTGLEELYGRLDGVFLMGGALDTQQA